MPITRRSFFANALAGAMTAGLRPVQNEEDIYLALVKANDARIPQLIATMQSVNPRRTQVRRVSYDVQALAAAYCAPESAHHKSAALLPAFEQAGRFFLAAQHADGTIDSGNLESPPDTGFVVETLATAVGVLRRNGDAALQPVLAQFDKFLRAAGEPLITGGIHTPNHRWVICEALARLHALYPDPRYVRRIDDWLGEGIYQDADGQYPERSTGIYSRVENAAFVNMARLLNRPRLLDPVRRNLAMNLYYTHPDGEIETIGSRRQDQGTTLSVAVHYLEYRALALRDRQPQFAAMARTIESNPRDRAALVGKLVYFLDEPLLKSALPASEPLPSEYAQVFANTSLARIRRGPVSATVYGGSDWPMGVASGLASHASFFNFRKGRAVLESMRLGASFFSKGHFRSQGLRASGNQYLLRQVIEVPYYQPLAARDRNPKGDYPLTPAEDRYWSKLDFPKRQKSEIKRLDQRVTITETNGAFELAFEIDGQKDVPVSLELCFRRGGQFTGVKPMQTPNLYLFEEKIATYRVGDDLIEFGPGRVEHERLNVEGASYGWHRGSSKPDGECVYLTGFTPFNARLTIK